MSTDAIRLVREAEEKAKAMILEAKEKAKVAKENARKIAEEKYVETKTAAEQEADFMKKKSQELGEIQANPILNEAQQKANQINSYSDKDLDSAVNFIIERIVNTNGNN